MRQSILYSTVPSTGYSDAKWERVIPHLLERDLIIGDVPCTVGQLMEFDTYSAAMQYTENRGNQISNYRGSLLPSTHTGVDTVGPRIALLPGTRVGSRYQAPYYTYCMHLASGGRPLYTQSIECVVGWTICNVAAHSHSLKVSAILPITSYSHEERCQAVSCFDEGWTGAGEWGQGGAHYTCTTRVLSLLQLRSQEHNEQRKEQKTHPTRNFWN